MDSRLVLRQLGFDDKEATVYLTTLELGMAPASSIARRADMKRPTVYEILGKLTERGVAECFLRKKMRYYSVISPRSLYEKYEHVLQDFQHCLPEMMARENRLVNKPKVTFYEGKEEVTRLYLDVLQAQQSEVLNYFLPDVPFRYFGEKWVYEEHIAKRIEKGIALRVLMPSSKYAKRYIARGKDELRETRMITDPSMTFTNEAYIYDNKMSTFSFDEDFALLIESEDVVRTQRILFELAWQSALVR